MQQSYPDRDGRQSGGACLPRGTLTRKHGEFSRVKDSLFPHFFICSYEVKVVLKEALLLSTCRQLSGLLY